MSKTLVLAVALSILLGSGAFFKAQAQYGPYPAIQSPPLYGCVSCKIERDRDLATGRDSQPKNDWERDRMIGPISPY
ncbi:MAG: hypothetical protein ABSF52_03770 [Syntrophobacteraceae bacterium]|jgi:hypothetical protein